jgi:hypothetical protein
MITAVDMHAELAAAMRKIQALTCEDSKASIAQGALAAHALGASTAAFHSGEPVEAASVLLVRPLQSIGNLAHPDSKASTQQGNLAWDLLARWSEFKVAEKRAQG